MLLLSEKTDKPSMQIKTIAKEKHLPVKYLEQVLLQLKKAGLLISTRGIHGGYQLAKKPDHIQFIDILEAVEGPLSNESQRKTEVDFLLKEVNLKIKETFKVNLTDILNKKNKAVLNYTI